MHDAKTPQKQQVLLLYQILSGRAWAEPEIRKLRVESLVPDHDRVPVRLLEIDCRLPEIAKAW